MNIGGFGIFFYIVVNLLLHWWDNVPMSQSFKDRVTQCTEKYYCIVLKLYIYHGKLPPNYNTDSKHINFPQLSAVCFVVNL